jgi:hypothetical protein
MRHRALASWPSTVPLQVLLHSRTRLGEQRVRREREMEVAVVEVAWEEVEGGSLEMNSFVELEMGESLSSPWEVGEWTL